MISVILCREKKFDIDKNEISKKFKETQMKLHPDKFAKFDDKVSHEN